MPCGRPWSRCLLLSAAVLLLTGSAPLYAQNNNNNNNNQNNNNNNNNNNQNTQGGAGASGVAIDAGGVLRRQVFPDPTGQLTRRRFAEARAALGQELARPSELRKVSLNRLEKAIQNQIAQGRRPTDAMLHLAGLTRLKYVFFYPETKDIVIAGPAEGWARDLSGRPVGLNSGMPVLELQDLVVALRAFPPQGAGAKAVFCSIDPTPEGLTAMQRFLQRIGAHATPANTQFIVNGLAKSLGLQKVTVGGISPKTHFAEVMVEADYRMKLIGIGLERPPVNIVSYVERANPATVARNAMQRWYFVPDYECVRVADDKLAMELVGDGVKLIGEDELVTQNGDRRASNRQSRASEMFVRSFTDKYPELARKSPVWAQLRNCIDLLVAAAFMQQNDYYGKAGWDAETFLSEQSYPVEVHNAPEKVATAVNAIWKGRSLMTPVGGGVEIEAWKALKDEVLLTDADGRVEALRAKIDVKQIPADQWWWD